MNILLLTPGDLARGLDPGDRRHQHLRDVLGRASGDTVWAGLIDGPIGSRCTIHEDAARRLHVAFAPDTTTPLRQPGTLMVGLPRPQTVRRLLREVTAAGIGRFIFFPADRSESAYGAAGFWSSGEPHRLRLEALEQALDTRIPALERHDSLAAALAVLPGPLLSWRRALDNYEATESLHPANPGTLEPVIAVGPERGWSPRERDTLRNAGFVLAGLGSRVLRVETASLISIALMRAGLGLG